MKHFGYYVVAALILGGLGYYMLMAPEEVQIDPRTMCPRGPVQVESRTTVIVIDRTDPITEIQQRDVEDQLTSTLSRAMPYERFVIYPLDARKDIVLDGLVRCNPLGPKKGGPLAGVGTDPAFDAKFFKEKFQDPLVAAIKKMLPTTSTTQTDSPIMELIQAVAVRDLKRSQDARLILVSDLMQHSGRFSQYKEPNTTFADFARRDAYKEVVIDLHNTSVQILYITRTRGPSRQPDGHEDFWQQYFSSLRVKSFVSSKVRGEAWK